MAYVNQNGQVRVGVRGWVPVFGPEDPGTPNTIDQDSINFILASGISDSVQTSAIETLVSDLKTYGLWTKMKAIYPFVGGSAASHKFNLKDPRDLDAAYRLAFNGGWVHSSNGAKPNGTNGYANTFLIPNTNLTLNDVHLSYYSKTNILTTQQDMGAGDNRNSFPSLVLEVYRDFSSTQKGIFWSYNGGYGTDSSYGNSTNINSLGFYIGSRLTSNSSKFYKNSNVIGSNNNTSLGMQPLYSLWIGGQNYMNTLYAPSSRESGFTSIGDGLSDTEASNFYTSVQKFQTTLGRHVGTPYVSDPDAIAFLMAAGITDGTQAAAINTLVIRMKADGVWTKMKAIYPFVGGTAASHKFNLKDPRDLDAAYRLVFSGGWIHSSTGAKPNGTTGYANTFLNESTTLLNNNSHVSVYSRTDLNSVSCDIGVTVGWVESNIYSKIDSIFYPRIQANNGGVNVGIVSSQAFYLSNRVNESQVFGYRNTTKYIVSSNSLGRINNVFYLAANHRDGTPQHLSSREQAFASIGDGLTDTEATAFYTAVQAYQTTLGRQVNIPVVSDTDAQAFLNAANITSFQQASAVNKLVVDLKAAGVWSKMKAIYPFVGGSAVSHKFNLKDPRDLDAAYRLVFNGGWVHSSTGAKPNGSNGYADTYLIPNTTLSTTNFHLSFYSRTISNAATTIYPTEIGSAISGTQLIGLFLYRPTNPISKWGGEGYSTTAEGTTTMDSKYFGLTSRTNSTSLKYYKNGSVLATQTGIDNGNRPNIAITIGRSNGLPNYSDRESAFASIGDGLTDSEATAFYTAVETYQTSLGRGVNTPIYNNGLVLNLDAGNANSYPGTGTTWFDLASGNNGTLTNGPTYDTANGGSLSFSTNKYVTIPTGDSYNFGTSDFTIEGWVNFNSITGPNDQIFVSKFTSWMSNLDFVFRFSFATPRITFLAGDLAAISLQNSYNITINTWYNYCVSRVSGVTTLYLNGIAQSSHTGSVNIPNDKKDIRLGYAQDNSEPLNGRMSGFKVYNRGLSSTEILNNFNSTRGRFGL